MRNAEHELSDWAVQRILARRTTINPFSEVAPERTALVVVDMQHGFVAAGTSSFVPSAAGIVERINRLAAALRELGGLVVFTKHLIDDRTIRDWSVYFENIVSPGRVEASRQNLGHGTAGYELWSGLDVRPEDLVIPKRRFGAFAQGSSDLDQQLRARSIDTLVVVGTVTNVCCESTAREAMMLNYKVFFVSDANAAMTVQEQQATLDSMALMFADVRNTESMLALLRESASAASRA